MSDSVTSLVIPTVGRPSLQVLLRALAEGTTPVTAPVIVVDDRPGAAEDLAGLDELGLADLRVVRAGGGGPARARNIGWRHSRTPWVSFLDDDVVPDPDWYSRLQEDLAAAPAAAAGSQGRVVVPLPAGRRPTDWERSTAGLMNARWITADMSYRRSALSAVGGFDERFPRAFREDADLGLRISQTQGSIVLGARQVTHPVRPTDDWVSVRTQAGNADDFLMRKLHGRHWRRHAGAPAGRRARHLAVSSAALTGVVAMALRRPRLAALASLAGAGGIAELAWARIGPGPRDARELRRMVLTSAVIPFSATWHSLRGAWRHRNARPWRGLPDAVLFDRDGTLVHDVPYNGDPEKVAVVEDAPMALERLRAEGIRTGVVSNQSGIGSGRITAAQAESVNQRIDELLGPFEVWHFCPHSREDGCECRKPKPALVTAACADLGVAPDRCVLIGDIGTDVQAAEAAGARGMLVPNQHTRPVEIADAERTADSLGAAVERILQGAW